MTGRRTATVTCLAFAAVVAAAALAGPPARAQTAPTFGSETITDQAYEKGDDVATLTLPEATDADDDPLAYSLHKTNDSGAANNGLPAGLSFDAAERTITGRPTVTQPATEYTYTATADSQTAAISFSIAVADCVVPLSEKVTPGNNGQFLLTRFNDTLAPGCKDNSGARAKWYTFTTTSARTYFLGSTIGLNNDNSWGLLLDTYMAVRQGHGRSGPVRLENDNDTTSHPTYKYSTIRGYVPAGAYTIEAREKNPNDLNNGMLISVAVNTPPAVTVAAAVPGGLAKGKTMKVTIEDPDNTDTHDVTYRLISAETCDATTYVSAKIGDDDDEGGLKLNLDDTADPNDGSTKEAMITLDSESANNNYVCVKASDYNPNPANSAQTRRLSTVYGGSPQITGIDTTDTTGPEIGFPPGDTPAVGSASVITLTDENAEVKQYGAVAVDGAATDATGCDTAEEIGESLTTLTTPGSPVDFPYLVPAGSAGKKVCAYAEDVLGNVNSALWDTVIVPDSTGPAIDTVAVTSSPPSGQESPYKIGDTITVTVAFNEGLVLDGTPALTIKVGDAEKTASCALKPDDDTKLECSYMVGEGDSAVDGIEIEADKLSGTIKDASENSAVVTYTAPGVQGSHKVDGMKPEIAFPPRGTPRARSASTITLTDAPAKIKRYGAIVVDGAATDASGCDSVEKITAADGMVTTETPALASKPFVYPIPADSVGKKICVYAEDAVGNSRSALWTTPIAVATTRVRPRVTTPDTNEPPTFGDDPGTTREVAENAPPGTAIGPPVAATAAEGGPLRYALGGADAPVFAIERSTGQIMVKTALDYEPKKSYAVTVTASDGSLSATLPVTIRLTNVPDFRMTSQVRDGEVAFMLQGDADTAVILTLTEPAAGASVPAGTAVTLPRAVVNRLTGAAPSVTVTLRPAELTGEQRTPPSGFRLGGTVIDVRGIALQPGETATVCLPARGGATTLHRYDEATSAWVPLANARVESRQGQRVVCATTDAFSIFAATVKAPGHERVAQQWLARFGRTIASGLTERVGRRLLVPASPGSHLVLGGQRLDLDQDLSWTDVAAVVGHGLGLRWDGLTALAPKADVLGDPRWPEPARGPRAPAGSGGRWPAFTPPRLLTLLTDSAFHLTLNKAPGTGWLGPGQWAAWGQGAITRFSGQAGSLALNNGEVLAGTLGVDYTQGPWLGGLAVAYNHGTGAYADPARQALTGDLSSTLTSVHPYLRWAVRENLDVWGLLGYGWGDLELTPAQEQQVSTDLALQLGAVGARGTVVQQAGATLALKADAFLVTMDADETAGLPAVEADAHRVRLALEGTYTQALAEGRRFTPTLELGLRQDGGDAETGLGVEIGGGLRYTDPHLGLTVEGRGRALLAHAESAYEEWGASGAIRLAPGPDGQGLAFALAPAYGVTASRMASLWGQEITALAPVGDGRAPAQGGLGVAGPAGGLGAQSLRLNAQLSYGMRVPSLGGLVTPFTGVEMSGQGLSRSRIGLTLNHVHTRAGVLGVELAGEHRETPLGRPEQRIGLQVQFQFNGGRRLPVDKSHDASEPAPAVRPASTPNRTAFTPPVRAPDLNREAARSVATVTGPRVAARHHGAIEPRTTTKHPVKVKPRTPPRKATTAGGSAPAGGRWYFVQLGAFSKHPNAVRAGMKLAGALSGVLRHHGRRLAVVESKHDGLSRVLFARAFRTRRAAAALCAAIKARGPDCYVTVGRHSPGRDQRRLRVAGGRQR